MYIDIQLDSAATMLGHLLLGRKFQAIKALRTAQVYIVFAGGGNERRISTELGLGEAKYIVDGLNAAYTPEPKVVIREETPWVRYRVSLRV